MPLSRKPTAERAPRISAVRGEIQVPGIKEIEMPAEKETEVPETGGTQVPKTRWRIEGSSVQEAPDNAEVAGRVPRSRTRAPVIAGMTEHAVREKAGGKTAPEVPRRVRGTLLRRRGERG